MRVVLDAQAWRSFWTRPAGPLAELLLRWAKHVDWTRFRKAMRGPKITRKRDRFLDTPHVSIARLLRRA